MGIEQWNTTIAPTWCPGCGNHSLWNELKRALDELKIPSHQTLIVYGIGCSGNMYNFVKTYGWHSLHGRAVPTAVGAKLANKDLTVIVVGGDGDGLGEGMSHFIHALRGNVNITYLLHNNKIYGLTTGQASPTSEKGFISRSTPAGLIEVPVKPLKLALAAGGSFVGRGYAGKPKELKELIKKGIEHRGFSFIDILQPCVTFNKINTYEFYNSRVYNLEENGYKPTDYNQAMLKADEWGEKIPLGLLYHDSREPYEDDLPQEEGRAVVTRPMVKRNLTKLIKEFM